MKGVYIGDKFPELQGRVATLRELLRSGGKVDDEWWLARFDEPLVLCGFEMHKTWSPYFRKNFSLTGSFLDVMWLCGAPQFWEEI